MGWLDILAFLWWVGNGDHLLAVSLEVLLWSKLKCYWSTSLVLIDDHFCSVYSLLVDFKLKIICILMVIIVEYPDHQKVATDWLSVTCASYKFL